MADNDAVLNALNGISSRMERMEEALTTLVRIEEKHEALEKRSNELSNRTHALEEGQQMSELRFQSLESSRRIALWVLTLVFTPILIGIGGGIWQILKQI